MKLHAAKKGLFRSSLASGLDDAHFPLTPALSLGEREKRTPSSGKANRSQTSNTRPAGFPIYESERRSPTRREPCGVSERAGSETGAPRPRLNGTKRDRRSGLPLLEGEGGGASDASRQRGSVLIIVLWISFGLVSITLYFAH